MPITGILKRNAEQFGEEISLIEINPEIMDGRREMTWGEFDKKANRFANLLLDRGIKEGGKVAILLTNCIEWLPIYFGILKTGALAVPLNFRNTSDEIRYCLDLAECDVLVFGPEFVERVGAILDQVPKVTIPLFLGDECPDFALSFSELAENSSTEEPKIKLSDDMDAVIYTSLQEPLAFLKPYSIPIRAWWQPARLKWTITDRRGRTTFSAYRRSTIQARRCTGSEASSRGARRSCCEG
jgi:long-chain acyl-CoA synthetase